MAEAGLRPNSEPAQLDWKYWRERTDWPGPRSFVMTRGEEILAHAATVPGACLAQSPASGTQRIRTVHVVDWAARPSATGAGVSLLKYIGQSTDALVAVGGSAQTLQLLPHLGFRSLGVATRYVRPVHPVRILTPSVHPLSRLLPRLARSVVWKLQVPADDAVEGWEVRRLESSELARLRSVLPAPTRDLMVFERSEALLRYALDCPVAAMELYMLERCAVPRGYFLLAFVLRQARLADFWMDSEDPEDWRALIRCAALQARQHRLTAELVAFGSDAAVAERLRSCGFHARDDLPVQALAPRHPQLLAGRLRVQMLDSDAAYRHGGRPEFWA